MLEKKNGSEFKYSLLKANEFDSDTDRVPFQLLMTVACLGVFSSVVCEFMLIMSALSGTEHKLNYKFMAGGVIVFIVCAAAAFIFGALQKNAVKKLRQKERDFIDSTTPVDGKIIAVNSYVKLIHHGKSTYRETLWSMLIEYTDDDGAVKTIESEKYLNDICEVLTDTAVKIYFKDNERFILDGFKLRKDENDERINVSVNEIQNGEDTVYTFNSTNINEKI